MKKILLIVTLLISNSAFADKPAEEMCIAGIMASGESESYALGFCRGTRYSVSEWSCAFKYLASGKSVGFAMGACGF